MTIFHSILFVLGCSTIPLSTASFPTTAAAADTTTSAAISLGTTIVAVPFAAGVIVAADSRTSSGSFVAHRWAHKIDDSIAPLVTVARAGSAAATQHILAAWQQQQRRAGSTTHDVTSVAHWFRHRVREQQQKKEESMSFLIAGIDASSQTPRIYSLAATGALVLIPKNGYACSGSGSSFAMTYLQEHCATIPSTGNGLDEETAIEHCRRAIEHAVYRDTSSGGCIRYRIVRTDGTSTERTVPIRSVGGSTTTTADGTTAAATTHLPGFAPPVRRPFPMVTKSKSVM